MVEANGLPGGGSLPAQRLQGTAVAITGRATQLVRELRAGPKAVIARVENDAVIIDLRTVLPGEDALLLEAVMRAIHA
jgi:L-seryl-tRNA(Ser) seleniumtransferase